MNGQVHSEEEIIHLERIYAEFFFYASFIRTFIAVIGFLSLYVHMHRMKVVVPYFINAIAACIIFGALTGSVYSDAYNDFIQRSYTREVDFHKWGLPFKNLSYGLGTIAHWLFSIQYFHLALYMRIMVKQSVGKYREDEMEVKNRTLEQD